MAASSIQVDRPSAIVTGAAGFIGSYVAAALSERGWRLGLAGNANPAAPSRGITRWGRVTEAALAELAHELGNVRTIIHCAGGGSVAASVADPASDFERTVASTEAVLQFMRERAPNARLVFISSAAVYGAAGGALSEETPKQPVSPYGAHKARAEDMIAETADRFALDAAILRLFSVYGVGLRRQLLWDLSRRALGGEAPLTLSGTGEESRDFLAVEDAAELIARLAESPSRPPLVLNGGSGKATTVRELAEQLLGALGLAPTVRFNGQVRAGDPPTLVADTAKLRTFGFEPAITLGEGLKRYAAWVRRELS